MEKNKKILTTTQKMSLGVSWMSAASIISRVIGALYIIPWLAMFGDYSTEANGLFNISYQYYSLFLIVATAGIPSAISKEMSFYTAQNEFRNSLKFFKISSIMMVFLGILAGGGLWLLAPIFAGMSPVNNPGDAVIVIRSLVPALITLPILSILRGFFESFQDMKPSALSQIYEQVIRVLFILFATFISINIFNQEFVFAVAVSTFAAFIGSIAAIGVLAFYFLKFKNQFTSMVNASKVKEIEISQMFKKIIFTALPFLITSSGITIMQLIDTNTFKPLMLAFSDLSVNEIAQHYAIFSGNVNKLIMIVISFSVAIGQTQVPILSDAFSKNDFTLQRKIIHNNLVVFLIVMIPSTIGVFIVAEPLYTVFYSFNLLGIYLLRVACLMTFILSLYFILYTSLQALNFHKFAVLGLLCGILVKLFLQAPMLAFFGTTGALLSTSIAFSVTNILYIFKLKKCDLISFKQIFVDFKPIFANTLVMSILSLGTYYTIFNLFDLKNRFFSLITLILVSLVGILSYFLIGSKNGTIDIILGNNSQSENK